MLLDSLSLNQILVILGFGAVLLELLVGVDTGFDLVLIGSTLIIGGFAGKFINFSYSGVLIASLLAFLYIFLGRKFIKSKLDIKTKATNIDNLVGKTGLVIKEIYSHHPGQVKIGSEVWRAESRGKIEIGKKIKVIGVEGVGVEVVKLT